MARIFGASRRQVAPIANVDELYKHASIISGAPTCFGMMGPPICSLQSRSPTQDAVDQTARSIAKAVANLARAKTDESRPLTATVWLRDIGDLGAGPW